MSYLPRLWIPGQVMHGVIRATDRAFLLLPHAELRNLVGACIGRALAKHPVQLHGCMANVNHVHFLVSVTEDTIDNGTAFFQYLNGRLAKELNKYWDRTGPVWGGRIRLEPCVDDASAEERLVYVMTNPVKDDLTEKVTDWMGFSTHSQLAKGKPVSYKFTNLGRWWKQGGPNGRKDKRDFVESVNVHTTPLPHWAGLSDVERRHRYLKLMKDAEQQHRERRAQEGKNVLGMAAILRERHTDRPSSPAKKSGRKPLCHASSKESYLAFRTQWRDFLRAYREASAQYRQGVLDVQFPVGSFRPPLIAVCGAGG